MFSPLCIWKSTPHPVLQSALKVYRMQKIFLYSKLVALWGTERGIDWSWGETETKGPAQYIVFLALQFFRHME